MLFVVNAVSISMPTHVMAFLLALATAAPALSVMAAVTRVQVFATRAGMSVWISGLTQAAVSSMTSSSWPATVVVVDLTHRLSCGWSVRSMVADRFS